MEQSQGEIVPWDEHHWSVCMAVLCVVCRECQLILPSPWRDAVPPKRVRVVGEAGVEVSGVIGPYPVDSSLTLHCRVENGE